MLRSGIPETLPGRALNIGERGLAIVLAGELSPGDAVAVQLPLRASAPPLRTRASVRHHNKLRCGVEFFGLSADQRLALRQWIDAAQAETQSSADTKPSEEPSISEGDEGTGSAQKSSPERTKHKLRPGLWIFFAISAVIVLAAFLWHWNRSWQLLESNLPQGERANVHPEARVPSTVMQQLIAHRVEPEYPAAARAQKLQAVILLDVIVGQDGSVIEARALNGPPILAQAAVAAVRWWRFEPYRLQERPAVVETTVAVEFKP